MRRFPFRLRSVFLLQLLLATVLGLIYWIPDWSSDIDGVYRYDVYYRGWPFGGTSSYWGRHPYRAVVTNLQDGSWLSATIEQPGFNAIRGYYANGSVREVGEYWVECNFMHVIVDSTQVRQGKYYRPDGVLGAEIVDGNGVARYWSVSGTLFWQAEYENGKYASVLAWYPNGALRFIEQCADGRQHGVVESFYENGGPKCRGHYFRGEKISRWGYYREDGAIESEEQHPLPDE